MDEASHQPDLRPVAVGLAEQETRPGPIVAGRAGAPTRPHRRPPWRDPAGIPLMAFLAVAAGAVIAGVLHIDLPAPVRTGGTVVIGVAMAFELGRAALSAIRPSRRPEDAHRLVDVRQLVTGLRLRHFAMAWPTLIVVIIASALLTSLPGLDRGWSDVLGGQATNAVFAIDDLASPGWPATLATLALCVMLLVAMPVLVTYEERIFRTGAERRTLLANCGWCLFFGLIHLVMGIPIGTALALALGGGAFTLVYLADHRRSRSRQWATMASSRVHLAYNATLVIGLAIETVLHQVA